MRNAQGTNTDRAGSQDGTGTANPFFTQVTVGSGVEGPDDADLGSADLGSADFAADSSTENASAGSASSEEATPKTDTERKPWARLEERASEFLGLIGTVAEVVNKARERVQGEAAAAPEEAAKTAEEEHAEEATGAEEAESAPSEEETTDSSPEQAAKERLINKLREIGITVGVESLRLIDAALEKVAKDPTPTENPNLRETITDKVVSLIPVVGISKQIADARAIAKMAKDLGDEKLMHTAKTKCLIALYEGNLDLLTLGAGKVLAKNTKLASAALRLIVGAKATMLAPYFEEFAGAVAKELLQSSTINGIVETILARPPEKEEQESADA